MERLPPNLRLAASALTRHPRALLASHDAREAWDECFVCVRFAFRVPSALEPFDARALVRIRSAAPGEGKLLLNNFWIV
jgi:hypothetical protein